MKKSFSFADCWQLLLAILILPWSAISLSAQDANFLAVTPGKVTLLIGQSQRFHLVDRSGRMQHRVSWTVSENSAFESHPGDELELTAKRSGSFQITAMAGGGT